MGPIDPAGAACYRRSPTNQDGGVRKAARKSGTHLLAAAWLGLTYLAILINCSFLLSRVSINKYVTMKLIAFLDVTPGRLIPASIYKCFGWNCCLHLRVE